MPAVPRMSGPMTTRMPWLTSVSSRTRARHFRQPSRWSSTWRGLAAGEATARVRAELVVDGRAPVGDLAGEVLLEVRLAQALTGPVGEGGDAVGRQAEEHADLGRRQALDLGVPQDGLPPLGQRPERGGDQGLLEALERGVDERHPGVVERQVVGGTDPVHGLRAVVGHPADGRVEVGAEGCVRAAACLGGPAGSWRRTPRPGRRPRGVARSWRARPRAAAWCREKSSPNASWSPARTAVMSSASLGPTASAVISGVWVTVWPSVLALASNRPDRSGRSDRSGSNWVDRGGHFGRHAVANPQPGSPDRIGFPNAHAESRPVSQRAWGLRFTRTDQPEPRHGGGATSV